GDIQLAVDLSKVPDGSSCENDCVSFYGDVVNVNLPFMKVEVLEESQKRASVLFKKNLTLSEKISYSISSILSKIGLGTESDKTMQILKEKMIEASKSQSEKAFIDLTTFFVHQLAKDITLQKNPNAAAITLTVRELASLAKENKLIDFLSFYFYLRAKHPELLVSSDIDESKKTPISPLVLYKSPQRASSAVKEFISMFKDKLEAFNKAIKENKIEVSPDNNIRVKDEQTYYEITKPLYDEIFYIGTSGLIWGLDEKFYEVISRLNNYLSNYEKNLDKFKNTEQEVKSVVEDINKQKKNDKRKILSFMFLFSLLFVFFFGVFLYLKRKRKKEV
ncbi:MAG: hypothetical protein ACP5H3_03035, partial [Candidatus Aenigmatarchaeota archaeon]